MNQQQLQTARLPLWGQDKNAPTTLDEVRPWMEKIGFCPAAPLTLPGGPPTPTLLEVFLGRPLPQPTLAERASIAPTLARLVQAKAAVPLLLISPPNEQPDFVVSLEALPFLYAMRGDRNWRLSPAATGQGRVSQLALHCWQELDRNGPQTLAVLQRALGQEVTGAAVLRALCELWGHLRVFPQWQTDDAGVLLSPTWDLLARQFPKQVSIGAGMGQPAALSGILSFYLGAVIAASDAEIVAFLSPLASQSKVREMLHGLTVTRQLGRVSYEGGMLLHLKDGLPPELLVEAPAPVEEHAFPERPARGLIESGAAEQRPMELASMEQRPMEQRPMELASMENDRTPRGPIKKWVSRSRPVPRIQAERSGPVREGAREGKGAGVRPRTGEERKRERPGWKQRPGRNFGRQRSDAGAQTGPKAGPNAGLNAGPGTGWNRPERPERPERLERPEQFAAGKPSPEKFRTARPARPAGRPTFQAETGSAPGRPFPKRFDDRTKRRKNFSASGEQGSERRPVRQKGPQDKGGFVRRGGPQYGPSGASRGGPQSRPKRAFSGAPKAGAKTWRKNTPADFSSRVPKTDWKRTSKRDVKTGPPALAQGGQSVRPAFRPGSGTKRERTSSRPIGPIGSRPARPGADKFGAGKPPDPGKFVADRAKPEWSGAGGLRTGKFGPKPPMTGSFGRDKAGTSKVRPGKKGFSKDKKYGRPGPQAAGGKQPFWAKPMHRKRKKHD